jgi:hypothetical protein
MMIWREIAASLNDSGASPEQWIEEVAPLGFKRGIDNLQELINHISRLMPTLAGDESVAVAISPPKLTIIWNPSDIDPNEYAEIVNAIGDVIRSWGGLGVQLLKGETLSLAEFAEVPQ